jgi:glutamate-1-semialdehyde 2,1-aminomutase
MLITPTLDPEFIRETVRRSGFVGLKCYHVYSPRRPTFDSLIEEYLPEDHVRIAHEEGLSITLHIVRPRALADVVNQETIRRYCQRYPNLRLILAHAARGFNPHHTILGIHALRGLSNVWFDTSGVTDGGAIEAILQTFGPQRVLYGSDFPVSHLRGRGVGLGDSFLWISADNAKLEVPYAKLDLALVGHESLRTLKVAAMSTRLSDSQVEDIFCNNGTELFGVAHSNLSPPCKTADNTSLA